jgi:hypothetical protein
MANANHMEICASGSSPDNHIVTCSHISFAMVLATGAYCRHHRPTRRTQALEPTVAVMAGSCPLTQFVIMGPYPEGMGLFRKVTLTDREICGPVWTWPSGKS